MHRLHLLLGGEAWVGGHSHAWELLWLLTNLLRLLVHPLEVLGVHRRVGEPEVGKLEALGGVLGICLVLASEVFSLLLVVRIIL